MEIQQHDGVVVDGAAVLRQGFAKLLRERRGVAGGEGGAQRLWCGCPPSPLYI